jgi:hypothetical protein
MVKIKFSDGTSILIREGTLVNGYKNSSADKDQEFYLERVFSDSTNGINSTNGSRLSTSNPMVGIMGFILSVDCFTIDDDQDKLFKSSAVVSVENSSNSISFG